jgi:hypothetical protein
MAMMDKVTCTAQNAEIMQSWYGDLITNSDAWTVELKCPTSNAVTSWGGVLLCPMYEHIDFLHALTWPFYCFRKQPKLVFQPRALEVWVHKRRWCRYDFLLGKTPFLYGW